MTDPRCPHEAPESTRMPEDPAQPGHPQEPMPSPMDTLNRRVTRTAFSIGGTASLGTIIALIGFNFGPQPALTLIGISILLAAGIAWIAAAIVVGAIILKTWWGSRRSRNEQISQDSQ